MMVGSEPMEAKPTMRARGFRPSALPISRVPTSTRRRAIDDAGGIAAGVHVVDALDLRVALQGHGVEAELLAHRGEGGLELARGRAAVVSGRMCSSWSSSVIAEGVPDRAARSCGTSPAAQAWPARFWLSAA